MFTYNCSTQIRLGELNVNYCVFQDVKVILYQKCNICSVYFKMIADNFF